MTMAAVPKLSVLVVEDNPDAAETLVILLDMQGYAVSPWASRWQASGEVSGSHCGKSSRLRHQAMVSI
jgi:hypothetical protein